MTRRNRIAFPNPHCPIVKSRDERDLARLRSAAQPIVDQFYWIEEMKGCPVPETYNDPATGEIKDNNVFISVKALRSLADVLGTDSEQSCSGHVASEADPCVCARCGVHIEELRP